MTRAPRTTRLRGLTALVVDAVTHGSSAVERIQKETAARPFRWLNRLGLGSPVASVVQLAYDGSVSGVHLAIRSVARLVGSVVSVALDVTEAAAGDEPTRAPPPRNE